MNLCAVQLEKDGRNLRVISHLLAMLVENSIHVVSSTFERRGLRTEMGESDEREFGDRGRARLQRESAQRTRVNSVKL